MQLTWKDIPVIPDSTEFLDVVLNRTQRKTPTVIRAGFKITRIRAFYMRKVRFTADGFAEKLDAIVNSFPRLDDIHPFHRDLLDTLYEKNHYKVSLAAVSRAKTLIETVSRDYVRLLKFGQSLFQCKQLKRAALGRMATIVKRLKDALAYLEQVRQHLGRLPSIDPNTRTLLICGYPNVGKSSFLSTITRAEVEVQPYAFTTKSLYVGHFDYKYLRFQAIDTPGILDRPTEEMNNIEMQSIYAIAHIHSCALYFMDLSEQCGFSVEDQVKLFHSIKPLFANKTVMIIINKIDLMSLEQLPADKRALVEGLKHDGQVEIHELSCATEENVMAIRNLACEKLLTARIERKMKATARINGILNKINVSRPKPRDDLVRAPHVPENARTETDEGLRLSKHIEQENGGAGVYQPDYHEAYLLENDEWKNDIIPEILNGRNVYDFIDPEISSKLAALEEEEDRLEQQGFYDSDEELEDEETQEIHDKAEWIRNRHKLMMNQARLKKNASSTAVIPRKLAKRDLDQLEEHFGDIGMDVSNLSKKARDQARVIQKPRGADIALAKSRKSIRDSARMPRLADDLEEKIVGTEMKEKQVKAVRAKKMAQRAWATEGRAGEADRHQSAMLPRHLFSGKRGIGKTQRR